MINAIALLTPSENPHLTKVGARRTPNLSLPTAADKKLQKVTPTCAAAKKRFGLADNLWISRTEAKEIIANYKREFPGIQQYMDDTIRFAKEKGYVETLLGRKRWLRDINSSNFTVPGFAERNAINTPVQGTAADMIKLAMIEVHKKLKASTLQTKMILQVHDELVFDVPNNEVEAAKKLIVEGMQSAMKLPNEVPVITEAGAGANWLEAH